MATLEELQQEIADLRSLITVQSQPQTGPEYSYPVVGRPVNDEMWQSVNLGDFGILEQGGFPYRLTDLSNVTNTGRLAVSSTTGDARARIMGFYHRMTESMTLDFPPVASTTTYRVCLEYNPLFDDQNIGPIQVRNYTNEYPTGQGRIHLPLWDVVRRPNQLLTDAEVIEIRPKYVPTLSIASKEFLDRLPLRHMLWGTEVLLHRTGEKFRAWGSDPNGHPDQWVPVDPSPWLPIRLQSGIFHPGFGAPPTQQRHSWGWELRGVIRRGSPENTQAFQGGTSYTIGYIRGVGDNPPYQYGLPVPRLTYVSRYSGQVGLGDGTILIEPEGRIVATPGRSVTTLALDGIRAYIQ
ncbi:hypothetical protein [Sediminivirga luteola]|uniref:Uncharacterized protein n=1 Tax=Sediminivirga luteola TaxID=1774748 RepID=A0A8J2TWZ6_9MICO|nr:hypothetical protein [Sediminivirga luteola]GGA10609.1 hypothetical protein GCM10011333_11760 [Sediminivirga luteola]